MDEQKVAFITCANNEAMYAEMELYLENLWLPEDIKMEIIPVWGAESMCAGYEKGRCSTNAKYKVYLHQDVLLIRKDFIQQILWRFRENNEVGMIGLAGCKKLPASCKWWEAEEKYGKIAHALRAEHIEVPPASVPECEVEAIDGVLIATQYDIPWRADLLKGWHFYDISISLEYRRHGYKIILPKQEEPWVIHCTSFKHLGEDYHAEMDAFKREYIELVR